MTALAPALLIVFFIITLILGIQLLTVNLIAGIIWLAIWVYAVYKVLELLGDMKTRQSTGFDHPNCNKDTPPDPDPRNWY